MFDCNTCFDYKLKDRECPNHYKDLAEYCSKHNIKCPYVKKCDRCGKVLTTHNNKCGFNICDKCNAELEMTVMIHRAEKAKAEQERYKDFILFKTPIPFNEWQKNKDIKCVQLHSIEVDRINYKYILGFCGQFAWENNQVHSLDGDSYNESVLVYGYQWYWSIGGYNGLNILVGNDW